MVGRNEIDRNFGEETGGGWSWRGRAGEGVAGARARVRRGIGEEREKRDILTGRGPRVLDKVSVRNSAV